jgi:hypothetical protein
MHILVPNLGWVRVIILTLWGLESKLPLFREIETGDLYFSQVVTLLKIKVIHMRNICIILSSFCKFLSVFIARPPDGPLWGSQTALAADLRATRQLWWPTWDYQIAMEAYSKGVY